MKLTAQEDVAAPIEKVFAAISDTERFERAILRRGAQVIRTDTLEAKGAGMCWQVSFEFHNRPREAEVEMRDYDPPNGVQAYAVSSGIEATIVTDLLALSKGRTRMSVAVDLTPKTIPARLLIQSLKLTRSNLNNRLRKRIADYATSIEG